jgi:hypothetical protein
LALFPAPSDVFKTREPFSELFGIGPDIVRFDSISDAVAVIPEGLPASGLLDRRTPEIGDRIVLQTPQKVMIGGVSQRRMSFEDRHRSPNCPTLKLFVGHKPKFVQNQDFAQQKIAT